MDEREFEILNILGKELGSNQRDLSQKTEFSLGMVNLLIRRLITKGYIRMEQLNKRNVQYILTPKGISEKMRQSIKYTLNTINSIGLIKGNVKELLNNLHKKGYRHFYIFSENDLSMLIERAFAEAKLTDSSIHILQNIPDHELNGVLLTGFENVNLNGYNSHNHINLLNEIANTDLINL